MLARLITFSLVVAALIVLSSVGGVDGARTEAELKACGKERCNFKGYCTENKAGNITGCHCTSNGFTGPNCKTTFNIVLGDSFYAYSYTFASLFLLMWLWVAYETWAWFFKLAWREFKRTPIYNLAIINVACFTRFLFYFIDPVDSWGAKGIIARWLLEILFAMFFACVINMYMLQLMTWIRVSRNVSRQRRDFSETTKFIMAFLCVLVYAGQLTIAIMLGTVEDPDETAGATLALFSFIGIFAIVQMVGFIVYGSKLLKQLYTGAKQSGVKVDLKSQTGKLLIAMSRTMTVNTICLLTTIILVSSLAVTGADRDPQVWLTTRTLSRILELFIASFSIYSIRILRQRQQTSHMTYTDSGASGQT
eukprot:TRINITY_DN385_c0_g1_i2.p1 TRINITY_DN385_c0_g1~~TRINITY_DN385_c0_g1_i2.p1  ORF type:complete len:364 (+),score=68.61 TRINITY_DN385_c0_g1_i2:448-1539(+)